MQKQYAVRWHRGQCVLSYKDADGKRHRHALGTADAREAEILAPAVFAEAVRPRGSSIGELWDAYNRDKEGRAIIAPRETTWKALKTRFASLPAGSVTDEDVKAHMAERVQKGIKDATIYTELSHLRTTLNWAVKRGLIPSAPYIRRPAQPAPREAYITKDQARALIAATRHDHVRLYIVLALGTGARNAALLGLKWNRCDFSRGVIDLRDKTIKVQHKGRAIVPMNQMVRDALLNARCDARSLFVIEWYGNPVLSVKKSIKAAAKRAGLTDVSPHVFRHSAAVWMAEDGVPMEEIAQYLGHTDINVTRKHYARYSPEYLRKAAGALEL